jgi:membrane fusion protein (multidrug efflux system)
VPTYFELEGEIQRLRDEQQRLRDEQEKLRQTHNGNGKNGGTGEPDDQNGHPGGKPKDDGGEKKDDVEKDGGEKKDDAPAEKPAEEPKAPLRVRAGTYVRTHPATVVIGAVALVLVVIGTMLLLTYLNSYESTDDAEVDGHLNPISSRIAGTVIAVYVQDNQFVEAGQVLADLDPQDNQASLQQANAQVAQSQAQLSAENPNVPIMVSSNQAAISSTAADVRGGEASVASAQEDYDAKLAAVRQAEVNHTKAALDRARFQLLVDKDEISKQQFDGVVAVERTAAEAVDAARAAAESARKVIDTRRAQLTEAQSRLQEANQNAPRQVEIRKAGIQAHQAAVLAARAQQKAAGLNLSYTQIVAPVSGIVVQKSAEVGMRVQPAQQLMSISQIDDIWITANFKETQLRRMKAGQSADVSVDAFGTTYHGYIESLPGATGAVTSLLPPENATGNYVKVVQRLPVRIRLKDGEDSGHRLRPGMSVEPKVWLNTGS